MTIAFLISSPCGRAGKTLASVGLIWALKERGYSVQPFKKGPDYIDPSWLSAASGRIARNLDPYLMPENTILEIFFNAIKGADVALVEGAMGLFDGPYEPLKGSSADLAKILDIPVILVIDTRRTTFSIAPLLKGFLGFDRDLPIKGVILNYVSGERHRGKLVKAIEDNVGIPVLGIIPKEEPFIEERHLGLIPFREKKEGALLLEKIGRKIGKYFDVERILEIGKKVEVKESRAEDFFFPEKSFKVGIFFDRVFNFYYFDNLQALQKEGAEFVFIDTLKDKRLPSVDGLYIGGGFPEFFLKELEENSSLKEDVAEFIEKGLPVYAECAGLMYLCKSILWKEREYRMAGVIDGVCEISKKPVGHGYVEVEVIRENPFFEKGLRFKGHEFHHSKLRLAKKVDFIYEIKRGYGVNGRFDGILYKNLLASYTHINIHACPFWTKGFSEVARRKRLIREKECIIKKTENSN